MAQQVYRSEYNIADFGAVGKLEAGATLQASGLFYERRSCVFNLYRGEDRRLAQQLGGGI